MNAPVPTPSPRSLSTVIGPSGQPVLALPHHFFVNLFQLSGTNDVDITQLVLRIRGEDLAAAPELLVRHGDRLLRFAFLLCGSEAAAQDLVQDTFLQALRSARRFRGRPAFIPGFMAFCLT